VLLFDPLPIILREVGQGHERPVQHRVAKVVVHDVEGSPHALGNLLDEAERAGILAHAHAVKGWILERDAPELVALKLEVVAEDRSLTIDIDDDLFRLCLELEVERIDQWQAVHAKDAITRLNTKLHRERPRRDSGNGSRHAGHEIDAAMGERANDWHGTVTLSVG
jgi:hypothetical protein